MFSHFETRFYILSLLHLYFGHQIPAAMFREQLLNTRLKSFKNVQSNNIKVIINYNALRKH